MSDVFLYLFWTFIPAVLLGLIPATIAHRKGRNFLTWHIYGTLLFVITLIHSIYLEPKSQTYHQEPQPIGTKPCPFCAEFIKRDAKVCRFCQREIPVEQKKQKVYFQEQSNEGTKEKSEMFDKFPGEYKLPTNEIFQVTKEGEYLLGQFGENKPERLMSKTANAFAFENSPIFCTFFENDGEVNWVRVIKGGKELLGERVV